MLWEKNIMKKIMLAFMLCVLMITGLFAADLISAEQVLQNNSTREIEDSYIETVTVAYEPDTTVDLEFNIYQISSDTEWLDGASLDFPTGVTVNSATDIGDMYCNSQTGNGITLTWGDRKSVV